MQHTKTFRPRNIPCTFLGCHRFFKNQSGLTQHRNTHTRFHEEAHGRAPSPDAPGSPPGDRASPVAGGGDAGGGDDWQLPPPPLRPQRKTEYHKVLNGRPCDQAGNFLPPGAPPPMKVHPPPDDYSPFKHQLDFHLADLLYRKIQMSAGAIDELMQNWAARPKSAADPPFADHEDLYNTIDATDIGHVPWESFEVTYDQPIPPGDTTPWKTKAYTVHFRDPRKVLQQQLANPDFKSEMDFAPKRVFAEDDSREYQDFMSGNWAWRQADAIVEDPATHGSTFVPIILGSDKTTVSVATGQNDYYPLYMSNGLVYNNVRRAHRNAVTLIGFLAIPKTDRENQDSAEFRTFRRNLFHGSLRHILESLRPGMTVPEVTLFADGHYRRVIYGLGPYIADYPEQVLLACTVQGWCARCTASNKNLDGERGRRSQAHTARLFEAFDHKALWDDYGVIPDVLPFTWTFPRADIYELLSPDLLHQVIKGTFKDHLVGWVGEYLETIHSKAKAKKIMADIDRRIAAVPAFPGLRRFPEGRGFKQWTGDDSKALMKVYLPAIDGHVPPQMLRAFSAFLDFCYLVRRNVIGEITLTAIDEALARYHIERKVFEDSGVCPNGFCLPRQHSLTHYRYLIQEFGAPNGLCSSITESKHIKAVKEPWRRSSRYQALAQMLTINERLDKLAAARVDFTERGMLSGPDARTAGPMGLLPPVLEEEDDDLPSAEERDILGEVKLAKTPVRGYPRDPQALAVRLRLPELPTLLRRFLYVQDHPDLDIPLTEVPLDDCPDPPASVSVFPSAVATFYAPSDQSGIGGLLRERIRAVRSWRGGPARYDCVYVEQDTTQPGFRGLLAARVLLFMSFKYKRFEYPCALVTWFSSIGNEPCPDVGMWMVEPDVDRRGRRVVDIIHIDAILRGAHLIPIFGEDFLPHNFKYSSSLDSFKAYYINKYADHHSHEIVF
ncbi:hypothetical protein C8F04DRAFT_1288082 [Mycena alexandri]|uniref:C2H2-type domain-containing protein n=1 Tax=Mycena alexandri TaxID=1745969 RepID=A0AAD6WZV6_9AGAR|nr:hypothetical protein C8F04DRAFT_1045108 [Mycena alexandri]KAJ7029525.1 hypothetical protein C8F04DRAFT_1288082 [Mycena alexandri]